MSEQVAFDGEDDDELAYIAELGRQWEAMKCRCGHARRQHPNHDMSDPNRNKCLAKRCRCKWFEPKS